MVDNCARSSSCKDDKMMSDLQSLKLAADQGDAAAQCSLGDMHRDGLGVAQDDKRAAALFKLAADQGYAAAQHSLGTMHRHGRGVAQDDKRAAELFKLAADQGDA